MPMAVQNKLLSMEKECQKAGGKVGESLNLLVAVDISGDDIDDYLINEGLFKCDGAAILFSSAGGSSVSVYVGVQDGDAVLAFEHGVNGIMGDENLIGVNINRNVKPAILELSVGGILCGQQVAKNVSKLDYKSCWRPLRWNNKISRFEFSELSMIRGIR